MPRREFPDFKKKSISTSELFDKLPAIMGNMALNFFDDSWKRKGFIDNRIERWPQRISKDSGRRILVKTGRLRRSLRMQASGRRVIIFTDVPYAKIHNEGGQIQTTARVSAHQRRSSSGKKTTVRAHNRRVNINMPQRQFMGHSELLDRRMVHHLSNALDKIF